MQLLGKECYDIDIALDNMLGKSFCEKVNEYLLSIGEKPEGIGVIQWYAPFLSLLRLHLLLCSVLSRILVKFELFLILVAMNDLPQINSALCLSRYRLQLDEFFFRLRTFW